MNAVKPLNSNELLAQIGIGNILAISGGRIRSVINDDGATIRVELPVSNGYRVAIELALDDTYTVSREFVRAGKVFQKGTIKDVYFYEVGEVAYRASCYADGEFGFRVKSQSSPTA
jgi:hypothetical protein